MEVAYFHAAVCLLVTATLTGLLECTRKSSKSRKGARGGRSLKSLGDQAVGYNEDPKDDVQLLEWFNDDEVKTAIDMKSDTDVCMSSIHVSSYKRKEKDKEKKKVGKKKEKKAAKQTSSKQRKLQKDKESENSRREEDQKHSNRKAKHSDKEDSPRETTKVEEEVEQSGKHQNAEDVQDSEKDAAVPQDVSQHEKFNYGDDSLRDVLPPLSYEEPGRRRSGTECNVTEKGKKSAKQKNDKTKARSSRAAIHSKLNTQQQHTPKIRKERLRVIQNSTQTDVTAESEDEPPRRKKEVNKKEKRKDSNNITKRGMKFREKSMAIISGRGGSLSRKTKRFIDANRRSGFVRDDVTQNSLTMLSDSKTNYLKSSRSSRSPLSSSTFYRR